MLNNPDQLEQKALTLLNQLPAFQQFMKNNSPIGGSVQPARQLWQPGRCHGSANAEPGTRLIQGQLAPAGRAPWPRCQSNLQSAQQQLDQFKNKLSNLGGGSGDIAMPDFKPNEQKTKTFWKRLEYGTNLQTTRTNYYFPTMTDIGLSVGYKINNTSTVGVGASYKIGWGIGHQPYRPVRPGCGVAILPGCQDQKRLLGHRWPGIQLYDTDRQPAAAKKPELLDTERADRAE